MESFIFGSPQFELIADQDVPLVSLLRLALLKTYSSRRPMTVAVAAESLRRSMRRRITDLSTGESAPIDASSGSWSASGVRCEQRSNTAEGWTMTTGKITEVAPVWVRLVWTDSRRVNLETGEITGGAPGDPSLRETHTDIGFANRVLSISLAEAISGEDAVKEPVLAALAKAVQLLEAEEGIQVSSTRFPPHT
jgi:hypothetical protein